MAFFLLWLTVFVMFLQPVFIWPALEPFQPLRNIALAALIAFVFSEKHSSVPSFFSIKTNKYFLFFVATQILSSFVMGWSGSAIDMFNLWLRMGIVYYLITQMVINEYRFKALVVAVVLGIVYLSYFSLSTYAVNFVPGMRVGGFGWYENPNDISIILVAVIPLALLIANTARGFLLRYMFMAFAIMFASNILWTGSRNGLLGLLGVGALSIYFAQRMPKLLRTVMLATLLAGIFTVGIANVLGRGDLQGLTGDDSSENRIDQWKVGLMMLKDYPVLGVGPGEFTTFVRDYDGVPGMQLHNTILQLFVETGIVGGIAFALLVFHPFIFFRKILKTINDARIATPLLFYRFICIALIGFWICAFFSNRYQFYILYVLIAFTVAVKNNLIGTEGSKQNLSA